MPIALALFILLLLVGGKDAHEHGTKIAVNNHLLMWKTDSSAHNTSLRYQCTGHTDKLQIALANLSSVYSISLGKLQNESQLYFIAAGMAGNISYMSKISVKCDDNQVRIDTVFYKEAKYSPQQHYFIVTVDPHGRFAVGCTVYSTLFYDLVSLRHWSTNITWSDSEMFFPTAIDIDTRYLYVVGYSPYASNQSTHIPYFKVNLYLAAISFNNDKYKIEIQCTWTKDSLVARFFPDFYFMSIVVNYDSDNRKILIGIPSVNTVHLLYVDYKTQICLQHISSKTQLQPPYGRGYGTGVAWLNQGQIVVVLDTEIVSLTFGSSSKLFYYDMLTNEQITNTTAAPWISPSNGQNYPVLFKRNIMYIVATVSTLCAYNHGGQVLAILPSRPGYYSINYQSLENVSLNEQFFYLIPNSAQCLPGTYKNNAGVWPCSSCKTAETNASILRYQLKNNVSFSCPQCINKTACPLENVVEVDYLPDIEQNSLYPKMSEYDIFDDILMLNMFRTEWNLKSPFYISMIVLSLGLFTGAVIILLTFSKRFKWQQQCLIKVFQHLDLIGQGELWFGGLISVALLVLAIFAAKFGHSYYYRYPIEKQTCGKSDSCEFNNMYNTKFDTSLQFLSASAKQYEQIFSLLNSQQFTLNIELINTLVHCGQLTLNYKEGVDFLPFSCYTNDRILYSSVKLTIHNLNLKFILSSHETIDALRIGITGPDTHLAVSYVQKLNFSKRFNQTDRCLSQNPVINVQLTKAINITEGLTDSDNTVYTGLWLPSFTYDVDQLFSSLKSPKGNEDTILSLTISETAFFVKNTQQPIARGSEIIFHTILFIGVCIDLICIILLLLKIWFAPIIIYFIHKLFHPSSFVYRLVAAKENSLEAVVFTEKLNAQDIKIKQLQQRNEIMSKRVDTLMEFVQHLQQSIKQ